MSWERNIVIKTAEEIEIMRIAGQINAEALQTVKAMVRPGITTAAMDAVAEEVIRSHGAIPAFKGYPGPYPYPATLTVSINDELVHGIPGKRIIRPGDVVSIDCGTVYNGFVGDSAFSMVVEPASEKALQLLEVTENSLYAGIAKMKAGNRVGDVSSAVQKYVESHGYYVTREYTGHGVGRNMHEGPMVPNYGRKGHGLRLRAGMTIAIEPMVLVGTPKTRVLHDQWTVVSADGSLTAHFEHSVLVTEGEPEILTAWR